MRKTKKLLSMLIALSISGAILPSGVLADGTPDPWPNAPMGIFHGVTNGDGYTKDTDYTIGHSDEIVKEGNYSLFINNINEISNRALITKIPLRETLKTGDTYKVSYWIYCPTTREGHIKMGNSTKDKQFADRLIPDNLNELNKWVYVEQDVTLELDTTNIQFETWKYVRYIDDLQVRKKNADGTYGENVVLNGDFEFVKIYNQNTQAPSHWYSWYSGNRASNMEEQNTFLASTDYDAYTGKRSMLVNIYQEIDNTNFDVLTYMDKGLENGKSYLLTVYMKDLEGEAHASVCNNGGENGDGSWNRICIKNGEGVGDGWYKITHVMKGDSAQDKTVRFNFWRRCTTLIDDVSLYELDSTGNIVNNAKNLIPNGDFEDYLDFEACPTSLYNANWVATPSGSVYSSEKSDFLRYEEVEPGNYAMHLKYADYTKDNIFTNITMTKPVGIEPSADYIFEYDIKASASTNSSFRLHPLGGWKSGHANVANSVRNVEATDMENGWRHCKRTITSAADATETEMTFGIDSRTDVLIDNITLYKSSDASKTNLITDGDFSATRKRNVTDLANVVAYPAKAGGKIVVSWTNANGTVENTKVLLNGTEQTMDVNNESDAFNEIVLDGTPGVEYTVKVSATINGTDKEYTVSAIPTEIKDVASLEEIDFKENGIGDWYSASWSSYIRDGAGYANTNISVVTENDNRVVNIKGNIPKVKDNTYAGIEQTVTLERAKLYHLYFKAKGENVTTFKAIEDVALKSGTEFWIEHKKSLSDDWTSYEIELDYTHPTTGESLYDFEASDVYDARLLLVTDNYAGNIWMDDVEVYEIDPDTGDKIGDNLIVNGGFDATPAVYNDPVVTGTFARGNTVNVAVTLENAGEISLITALYKDDQLINVGWMEKIVGEFPETYDTSITVPDEDGVFTAKVMYWESVENMTPCRNAFEIK